MMVLCFDHLFCVYTFPFFQVAAFGDVSRLYWKLILFYTHRRQVSVTIETCERKP